MTSRVAECRRYSQDAFEALKGLEEQDSKELLLKAAEIAPKSWPAYDDQVKEVVNHLGSHTLALIQAGAYVSQGHCQLYQYPKVSQRQRQRLLKYRPKQAYSRYRDVYATFEASADVLEQSQSKSASDALRLLEILSMLGFNVLPLQIFEEAWKGCKEILQDSDKARTIDEFSQDHVSQLPNFVVPNEDEWDPFRLIEAVSLLASLSLVTRHDLNNGKGLSMHPLTHAWAKDRQYSKCQGVAWIAAGCVLGFSRASTRMWQTQERHLLSQIQSYLDVKISTVLSFGSEVIVIPIILKCGWTLLDMRQDSRLSHLLEDIFTELRKKPEEPLQEFLPLYDLQARSLLNIGKEKIALALLEKLVKAREATIVKDHPDLLASQHTLARAYNANGQVKDAVELHEQVIKIREVTLAKDHPDLLDSQHMLACTYYANGQIKEAVAVLEQVVQIRRTTLVETHPQLLDSQHDLALAYEANGQVNKAVALLEPVVQARATMLAETHPQRLASQHALARAYQANGQVVEAVALLEQVVRIRETTLAETHPHRLASQHALAMAYQANGQVVEAIALLEQVVRIQETTLAETHPDRLASQHVLAGAYQANGQVGEAVALLEQVVKIKRLTLPMSHPSRVVSENALSYFLQLL
ncbi:hypothetical protein IFR05_013165 [Cadophora sp. M221]|nr:hypothetical protein IFR05_013165 [Cadophora sp. M221]